MDNVPWEWYGSDPEVQIMVALLLFADPKELYQHFGKDLVDKYAAILHEAEELHKND